MSEYFDPQFARTYNENFTRLASAAKISAPNRFPHPTLSRRERVFCSSGWLIAISYQLSAISYQLSAISYQLLAFSF
jgi:hypothetical protein